MTAPGVGPVTALWFVGALDDVEGRGFVLAADEVMFPTWLLERTASERAAFKLQNDENSRSRRGFDFNPAGQPHKSAFRWCYRGVCPTRNQIKHVYDRATDVFPPRKHYQAVANFDCLILNGVGETEIIARNDLHGQLALRENGDPRPERREPDLEHLADA
jgi:hypothetical protein